MDALTQAGIAEKALHWFASFPEYRNKQVIISNSLSRSYPVFSGVIQGFFIGAMLYTIFEDTLFWQLKLPALSFAEDIRFIVDVSVHSQADVQYELDIIVIWSLEHKMVLKREKNFVVHCGKNQPYYV